MKISVITVCRNAEKTIEETVKSVFSQKNINIEYIVIDGKSTDGTNPILNKYKNKFDCYISEKDKGIYDAMNKGIGISSGDWVFFLNSGDTFTNDFVLSIVSKKISEIKRESILHGNVITRTNDRSIVNKYKSISRCFLIRNTICHQALFTKRSLYENFGDFDLKYKIAADYEWLLRMLLGHKISSKYINLDISNYSLDGVSNDRKHRDTVLAEYSDIRKKYFSKSEIDVYELISKIIDMLVSIKKFAGRLR